MPLPRRAALMMLATAAPLARTVPAQAQPAPSGPFTLPPLPYAPRALEPHIDAQTMMLHHDRHHAAYVANLNAALKDAPALAALPIQELLLRVNEAPEPVRAALRNNGGGHANHTMFWQVMGGTGGPPAGELGAAIDRDLGGYEAMKAAFNRAGLGQFGSGWVFVTVDRAGKLAMTTRPNQDTPLMDGGRVLFGNDVWEHAYYLKYQNRRADYLNAWWNVISWDRVSARLGAAQAGTLEA